MEGSVNAMENNPDRENIMRPWNYYIIGNAIIVIEKPWKPASLKQQIPAEEYCV